MPYRDFDHGVFMMLTGSIPKIPEFRSSHFDFPSDFFNLLDSHLLVFILGILGLHLVHWPI